MRKRRLLRVVEYEDFVPGQGYVARVVAVKANHKTKRLHVQLEHLNPEQDGRVQEMVLPLPILPDGRSAAFFRACGIEVQIDQDINQDEALGKHVIIRFGHGADGQDVSFGRRVKEVCHGTSTR